MTVAGAQMRTPRSDSVERILAVTTAVRRDLSRHWSVNEMADIVGIKAGQLRRLCSAAIRTSPVRLLKDLRYAAAADLLQNPQLRIKEVLTRVGLTDGSHFCRDFRKRYGTSPLDYQSHHLRLKRDSAHRTAMRPIDQTSGTVEDATFGRPTR